MKTLLIWIVVYAVMAIVVELYSRYDLFKIIGCIILGAFTIWYWHGVIKDSMKK